LVWCPSFQRKDGRELTETAFANSCCSVFHSSIVKVLSSMQYMLRNKIGLVLGPLKQGQPHAGTTHLGKNHWEDVTTRSLPLVFITHLAWRG
jgi:hypothetical protein